MSNLSGSYARSFKSILIYHIPSHITQEDIYFHISSRYGNFAERLIRFPKNQPKMVIGGILVELEESLSYDFM